MRCDMEELITKITSKKLDRRTVVSFALLSNLPDCLRINTKDYINVLDSSHQAIEATPQYNKFDKPSNMIECDRDTACLNTGSLVIDSSDYNILYKLPSDATKYSSGLIIFYIKKPQNTTSTVNVSIELSDTATFENSDKYTMPVTLKGAEFAPVLFDLSGTPMSTTGTGWTASATGNYMTISVDTAYVFISSIAIFESIEDFENNDVVQMGCLSSIDGDDAIDAAEATCADSAPRHDTESPTFERTITGTAVTSNYQKLNPLIGKGSATTGFKIHTEKFTPVSSQGGSYGEIVIGDMYQKECGFVTVDSGCELLKRYNIPIVSGYIRLDEDHFIVQPQEDGTTKIFVDQYLVGKELIVSYPREAAVTEYIADIDNVDGVRVKMYVPYELSNGVKRAKVYGNVLVTSFSDPRGEDDAEFSVTVSIQKASDGHYYHIYDYE